MRSWWADAVFYEIYIRSFQDSNDDGVGDLNGIAQRLDYLAGLGVDAGRVLSDAGDGPARAAPPGHATSTFSFASTP